MLPRLLLRSGPTSAEPRAAPDQARALPVSAVPDVLTCLMLCRSDLPYAGLFELQRAISAESLAEFGRALFKWWLEHDAPAKERWVLDIQGLLGDHQTVAMLNRALLAWRQALNRVRAYDALKLIAQIGSDAALMHLTAWADHPRYNDLASRARILLTEVAEARGLSLEELGDRTVPDLGFDQRGELRLDFGPRQFVVRLDSRLQTQLHDAAGRPLKSLPAANGKDDAALAKAAKAHSPMSGSRPGRSPACNSSVSNWPWSVAGAGRWPMPVRCCSNIRCSARWPPAWSGACTRTPAWTARSASPRMAHSPTATTARCTCPTRPWSACCIRSTPTRRCWPISPACWRTTK